MATYQTNSRLSELLNRSGHSYLNSGFLSWNKRHLGVVGCLFNLQNKKCHQESNVTMTTVSVRRISHLTITAI